jgi:hypothetical protein
VPVQPWPAGHPEAVEKSRPYDPSSQPALQSEQRSGDVVPGLEYAVLVGHDVHSVAPEDWLYRPAGHAKQVPLELYIPVEHMIWALQCTGTQYVLEAAAINVDAQGGEVTGHFTLVRLAASQPCPGGHIQSY